MKEAKEMFSLKGQKSKRRNLWVGSAVIGALVVGVALGTAFATRTAEAQSAERNFSSGTGMILNYVNAANASDFEAVMQKLAEGLQNSENADRNRQAEGWKVYRAQEAGPNNSVLYVWFLDPAVSGADYRAAYMFSEFFPEEAQALYERYSESFAAGQGQSVVNLDLVVDF
jgi:hypothetical protein